MLTALANVKEYLKIPVAETGDDNILNRLISAADEFVKVYCKRGLEAQAYTEYHSTKSGQDVLMLEQYPVNSITSIHDDPDRNYGSGSLIDTTYYVFEAEPGIVRLDGVTFYAGFQNVKVIYNAGYATIPADLEQATIELVAQKFNSYDKIRQGIVSRTIEGETVRFFLGELFPETKAVLDRYRKIR